MSKKRIKYIFRKVRNANLTYNLIQNGDRVAAALSGGKDSITLLYFLHLLKLYTPLDFKIIPVHIDLGFGNDIKPLNELCRHLNMTLVTQKTNIGKVVFEQRKETNPCSLCSNLRSGALNRLAKDYGCNKVALGHHLDDAVATMFMSMLFEGQYRIFKPKTFLDRINITVVRPMIYVEEHDIAIFVRSLGLEPVKNICPADNSSKRKEIGILLADIESKYPGAKKKFLASMENINPNSFWK